ncbi:MAG TPA: hypothetical protein DD412_04650 [Holosporales bacterium]|nr:hypothetical protein [Holosporales bacterium]
MIFIFFSKLNTEKKERENVNSFFSQKA